MVGRCTALQLGWGSRGCHAAGLLLHCLVCLQQVRTEGSDASLLSLNPAPPQLSTLVLRDFMWGQLQLHGATSLSALSVLGEQLNVQGGGRCRPQASGAVCVARSTDCSHGLPSLWPFPNAQCSPACTAALFCSFCCPDCGKLACGAYSMSTPPPYLTCVFDSPPSPFSVMQTAASWRTRRCATCCALRGRTPRRCPC